MDCRVKPGNDEGGPSPQIQFLEKVIALAADDAKRGKSSTAVRRIASMPSLDSLYILTTSRFFFG
jgi:hypothetical protein